MSVSMHCANLLLFDQVLNCPIIAGHTSVQTKKKKYCIYCASDKKYILWCIRNRTHLLWLMQIGVDLHFGGDDMNIPIIGFSFWKWNTLLSAEKNFKFDVNY